MIVKSTWRQAGGLEPHLMRSDTNEVVQVRTDLFRGAADLHGALRLMEALALTNAKMKRASIHVVISPDHVLTESELVRALAMVETEHAISPEAPRAVVAHSKGARATHVHAVYPTLDPASGKAVRSQGNYERDELISRRLEIAFGERVIPGPLIDKNIAELRRRGLDDEAGRLADALPTRNRDGLTRADRQHATRLKVDAPDWSRAVFALFQRSGENLPAFAGLLAGAGLSIARGTKSVRLADEQTGDKIEHRILVLVDDRTGFSTSLVRLLRREAKASGRPIDLRERDLATAFAQVPDFARARDDGLERAHMRAEHDLAAEQRAATLEAALDGEEADLDAYRRRTRKKREDEDQQRREAARATLRARREAIAALYRERDDVRRQRVDRAFRAARLLDVPQVRRLAFALAAGGVLLSGGGLALALAGGAMALELLPTRARARAAAAAARRERAEDSARRRSEIQAASAAARAASRPTDGSARVRFTFNAVPKADRVLAGLYVEERLRGTLVSVQARAAAKALGPEVEAGLVRMLELGSPLQVRRLQHWFRGIAPDRRSIVVEAALRRHAGADAQARRTLTKQRRTGPTRSERDFGR